VKYYVIITAITFVL